MKLSRNDIKISFGTPSFTFNEAKGMTTCVIKYSVKIPEIISSPENEGARFAVLNLSDAEELKTVGIAYCTKNDKYDKKTGAEIAEARAEAAAYMSVNKKLEKLQLNLSEMLYNWQNEFSIKAAKVVNHNAEYIKNIGNNNN